MTIHIASDHAGWQLKEQLKPFLQKAGYEVRDLGAPAMQPNDDYPLYAKKLARIISNDPTQRGILICGSGQGVCIVANRFKNVRATLAWNEQSAHASRNDDNSNILCLGARLISSAKAKKITLTWLKTPFSGAVRHKRRIQQINTIKNS